MNPDDIARILDELGQRLGPSGEYVFGLAVRQKVIEGLVGLALIVSLVALAVAVTVIVRWRIRLENAKHPDETSEYHVGIGWKALCYGTVWSIALCAIAIAAVGALTNLLNPEYAALTDILSRIVP